MKSELIHDWSEKPRPRLKGTLSLRLPKSSDLANDEADNLASDDKPTQAASHD